tara:strand:- start:616 stop:1440 length:825 start_codon:yes stop_codon:yes gene_type:complete
MKFLVLGSSGQLGHPLCSFLKEEGNEVIEFDIVEDESQDLRIYNSELLKNSIKECDFVFFLAFDVGGSRYLEKYQHSYDFLHNNMLIMSNTFKLLKEYKKPFIFASSQMSNMNHSPYGILKSIGEKFTTALDGLTVKFWNVYGPEKNLEKSHVITDFILMAKNEGMIKMRSDGTEVRQFLHARDCSSCLLSLAEKYDKIDKNKEYHVTSFKWHSIIEIAKIISSEFNNAKIIPSNKKDKVQNDKKNEASEHILNFWKPQIDIKTGIKMVIEEMK